MDKTAKKLKQKRRAVRQVIKNAEEERILKNYLNGKYGALPHMDLEIAFKHILEREANNLESSKEQ